MSNQKLEIEQQMEKAGTQSITPTFIRLDGTRVMLSDKMKSEEFLLKINGTPCFPRCDVSSISGGAKTGKTTLITLLILCALLCNKFMEKLGFSRVSEKPLRVMWVDTEQSRQSTLSILKRRICKILRKMVGDENYELPDDMLYVFNLRSVAVLERFSMIVEGVQAYRPDIVIIDNIRDLLHDINNGEKSQELIEGLMQMASEFKCNVVCVLHQNRSSDNKGLRRWLGTELTNKAYEVFTCQKIRSKEGEKPVFLVEQTLTRRFDMDRPLCYKLNDEEMPEPAEISNVQPRNEKGQFTKMTPASVETLNQDYIIRQSDDQNSPWSWDLRKLFDTVIGARASVGYQDLKTEVMAEAHIRQEKYYEKVFAMAEDARVVRKDTDRCGRIVVIPLPL